MRISEKSAVKEAEGNGTKRAVASALNRSMAMTEIIRMMESERNFADIVSNILERVCCFLNISGGSLLRLNQDTNTADMICEWRTEGAKSLLKENQSIGREEYPFLTGKPYVISSHSFMRESFREFFKKYQIAAGIFLPVAASGQATMYLNFTECQKEHVWDIQEIEFINDVKRIVHSILSRCVAKNSLSDSCVSLETILENVGCGICVKDLENGQLLFANAKFRIFFSESLEAGNIDKLFKLSKSETGEDYSMEFYLEEKDRWFDINGTEIMWVDKRKVAQYTVYDITETKRYQQKIERQANNDFLTGLYNRMRCEQDLSEYIKQTMATNGHGAVLYMDLDDFKHINDGLGCLYGDALLKAIAYSLQRIPDIENSCYRTGGDEFVIIVEQQQYSKLDRILSDIKEIFAKPWFLKGADYYCTISMGIARFPADGDSVQELIKKADIALYEAKKTGKNKHEFYSQKVVSKSFERLDLEKNMREATLQSCNEFEVYYQPIFDVSKPGNPCTGAEALIRWNSKSLGFISPIEFIPLAEYLGLINPIGNHVLREACLRCKHWNDSGHPEYKVNVNLSVIQLLQNDIADTVADIIQETHIRPGNVTFEVTESLALNDMVHMKIILGKIKSLGVRVALDDFGTGYSSLNYIRELPIDLIKIDRCFIKDLGKDEFSFAFVKTISELAETMGMNLCVEGVECKEQYEILKKMNVNMIQGFFFERPITYEKFEDKYL